MSRKDVVPSMMNLKGFNDPDAVTDFKSSINAAMPLFRGGEILSAIKARRYAFEIAKDINKKTKEEIALEVTKSYLEICWLKSRVKAARSAVKTAGRHVKQAKALYTKGMALKADLLKAKVYLSAQKERLVREKTSLNIARRKLSILVGKSPQELTDTESDIESLYARLKRLNLNLNSLINNALNRRKDLTAVRKRINIERQNLRIAYSDYFPKIDVVSSWEWHGHNFPGDSDGAAWSIGAVAKLNIFDGLIRERKVKKAKARIIQAEELAREKEKEVVLEVISSVLRIKEARENIRTAKTAVAEARESLKVIEKRYSQGLATITELTDTQTALEEAKARYLGALHQYLMSVYSAYYSAGSLLEFIGVGGEKGAEN
ncbi:MAG: TolC family protein [Deferribacteres bacterium]|nr:TolC family protein [Deferribacteres bacterium]